MRDKLTKLVKDSLVKNIDYTCKLAENITDDLLANGVIVPPCKVGDVTYIFDYEVNNHLDTKIRGIAPSVVEAITIVDDGLWIENEHAKYHISSVGYLIFLTREEAEKALKEAKE